MKIPNVLHVWLPDVDLIMIRLLSSLHTYVPSHVALKLVNGMLKFTIMKNEQ